jgi:hypothetical protein
MENTSEHLEHIEHTKHAAHAPFDRNVAMTMAMVAAVLACVGMLGHRAHNETLKLQADANSLLTQADIKKTEAANQWAYYQAKNNRMHEYRGRVELLPLLAINSGTNNERHKLEEEWSDRVARYQRELPDQEAKARGLDAESLAHREQADEAMRESREVHHRADRLDLAQLAVELSLVLSSLAVLTKRSGFWFAGIAAGVVGVVLALTVLAMH